MIGGFCQTDSRCAIYERCRDCNYEPELGSSVSMKESRSRSMRKIMKHAILTFLLLGLALSTALLAYLHFFAENEDDLSGTWTAELDMTERAAVTALDWLQDIEGVTVSLEDMEHHMRGLTIQVSLEMEKTDRSAGTFQCNIEPESYETCYQAVYEAFAECFRELLGERLRMAGYEGSTEQEAVEELVNWTFGMSTVSYLMSCGPALLPSIEELQAQYDGSGTYEIADGVLTRRVEAGEVVITKEERYIRQGGELILTGEAGEAFSGGFFELYPVVYILEQ